MDRPRLPVESREEIDEPALAFLLSEEGRSALAGLLDLDWDEFDALSILAGLRRRYPPAVAAALLSQARLRRRAAAKFPRAAELFFTAEALEQATAWPLAQHRADWIHHHAPPGPVLDLGCGIGADLLALAERRRVIAYEIAPTRLRLAQANAAVLGLADRIEFRLADWTRDLAHGRLPNAAAAFADPVRRLRGERVFSLHRMQPPIAALQTLQRRIPALAAKVAPGIDDAERPPECAVEFVSHNRVCKEAVLWFGPLRPPDCDRWASVYADGQWRRLEATGGPPRLGPLTPGQFLHEPDPAVIRAGAFAELCARLDAHLLDPHIAYLAGPRPGAGSEAEPFVQSFVVEEVFPSSLKRLNRRLQSLGIGYVELKKRGVPFEPESLRPRLRTVAGGRPAVIFFTRLGRERTTILGRRWQRL